MLLAARMASLALSAVLWKDTKILQLVWVTQET